MTEFANKTQLHFEPGLSAAAAVDATGQSYATPDEFAETLGDLARMSYIKATFRYRVELDAASSAGQATIKLKVGTTTLVSEVLDLSAATTFRGSLPVDVADVLGGSQLKVVLTTDTAADASRTAQVAGQLNVEHPLVIGGG